uniref:hypothetical protein n=1 Tax=Prevotella micans TaxID=189723 RepID=UPI0002E496DD|nr:hypothetical protein [Prevotella micans]
MNKENNKSVKQLLCEKGTYVSPWSEVVEVEEENFFCTSVLPGQGSSTEDDWDNDEDIDGDTDMDL